MTRYLALLRGVNVGGKATLPMAALREALEKDGFQGVKTYINSGNVFVSSPLSANNVAKRVSATIKKSFGLEVGVAVFTKTQWQQIIDGAPQWWGQRADWKHNLIVLIKPYEMAEVVKAVGTLKPDIEAMEPGDGVLYQSMSIKLFGRTTTGKLASSPIYKRMTVRSYNTAHKLLGLFD